MRPCTICWVDKTSAIAAAAANPTVIHIHFLNVATASTRSASFATKHGSIRSL